MPLFLFAIGLMFLISICVLYIFSPLLAANWGWMLIHRGRREKALGFFRKVQRSKRNIPFAHFRCGNGFFQLEAYEDALISFQKALEGQKSRLASFLKDKKLSEVLHYNIGLTLNKLGRYQEAIAAFEENLALQPDHAKAWWHIAEQYWAMARLEPAMEAVNKALAVDPGLAQAQGLKMTLEKASQSS